MEQLERRVSRLEDRIDGISDEVARETARCRDRTESLTVAIRALEREVGGINPDPQHPSLRERMHQLENDRAAAKAAEAAVNAALAVRRDAKEKSRSDQEQRLRDIAMWAFLAFAALGTLRVDIPHLVGRLVDAL